MIDKSKYRNEWIEKTYDRINLTVPKGRKEQISAYAAAHGESVNGLINRLLDAELGDMITVCGGIQQDPLPSVESPKPRKKTARE